MWQCELILEIVMCVMGMFYKQEFKRETEDALEADALLSVRLFSVWFHGEALQCS